MKKFSAFGVECTPAEMANAHETLTRRGYQHAKIEESGNFRGRIHYGAMGNVSFNHDPFSKWCFTRVVVTENNIRTIYWYIWDSVSSYCLKKVYALKQGIGYTKIIKFGGKIL